MKKKVLICFLIATTMLCSCGAQGKVETGNNKGDDTEQDSNTVQGKTESYINFNYTASSDDVFEIKAGSVNNSISADGFASSSVSSSDESFANFDVEYTEPIDFNTEEYTSIKENGFINVSTQPLSTFAIDVDTGSYSNFRRFVNKGQDIPTGSIRTEEMINYFDYNVSNKSDGVFSVQTEMHPCAWNEDNNLLMITVQTNRVEPENNRNNFVYLIDVSGSMAWEKEEKIELALKGFARLTDTLGKDDIVSIVTYSGSSETLLNGAKGSNKEAIGKALNEAFISCVGYGGGTNGSGGIEAAYKCAEKHFIKGGNNRVIIASDGDMNLGISSNSGLVDLITKKKESGVFLTTLGFGEGNYSDTNMEAIADAGNGNYYYIDSELEAERVLVEKMKETTITVAKDVKIQVEFNPVAVKSYRLIGYENRLMSADDFKDDTKDGGEVGAGQQITVFYELSNETTDTEPDLKYQENIENTDSEFLDELLTINIRYKEPDGDTSEFESFVVDNKLDTESTDDYDFAKSVVLLAEKLRNGAYSNLEDINTIIEMAERSTKNNKYREEFCELLKIYNKNY